MEKLLWNTEYRSKEKYVIGRIDMWFLDARHPLEIYKDLNAFRSENVITFVSLFL